MALLKIARMGHPILMKPAEPIYDFDDPGLRELVESMFETMFDAPGIGLAAPQVHVSARVVVYYIPEGRAGGAINLDDADNMDDMDDKDGNDVESGPRGVPPTVLINPELQPLGDELIYAREGCLSLPGMSGMVRRPKRVALKAFDLNGDIIEQELDGFHARVIQHECDHLDGFLYPMRMDDLSSFGYDAEMRREIGDESRDEPEGGYEETN